MMTPSRTEIAVLVLAVKKCRAMSAERREQVDAMLEKDRWGEVALFCSYCCQCEALRLKPWEDPPMNVNDPSHPEENQQGAARLARRMIKHGVSRWHPDPIRALARAERRRRCPRFEPLCAHH